MTVHTFCPSTWEAVLSSRPPGLQDEFRDSQGCVQRNPVPKSKTNNSNKKRKNKEGQVQARSKSQVLQRVLPEDCLNESG